LPTKTFRTSIKHTFFLLTIVFVIGIGLLLTWITSWHPYWLWLAATSVVLLMFFGYDKFQARNGGFRVPEITLHGLALVGGFPGGWAGMILFRHKTRKKIFTTILLISSLIHIGLIYWIFLCP
jgi:uncharacterized membrane protein YsdA (DUF1294 family)